ncbi:hypothetical protein LK994_02325 [Ferruginibacter lapsinanis]|uniref:hypothetical protein n=1 Tax=Ferruginibacter lapsinanis TaxID=563172 RepID=UPI001E3B9946|nr:hypothetical protein [Ferruginibacter lapsinanis]UEG50310.1 hypothetical protein LK994_02325 [Ferruginibacter lapsinanis]
MKKLTITQLEEMPHLLWLITNYVTLNYEEAADTSPESLVTEYNHLVKQNKILDLFEAELITSESKLNVG